MARFRISEGFDSFADEFVRKEKRVSPAIGYALYQGAKIVAKEIEKAIQSLPVGNRPNSGTVTALQKQGLLEGMGISKKQKDGSVSSIKVGFDGYNRIKTKNYPKGQPNVMIARSVESGTSFRKKTRFITNAVKRAEKPVQEAMKKVFEKTLEG